MNYSQYYKEHFNNNILPEHFNNLFKQRVISILGIQATQLTHASNILYNKLK